MSPKAELEVCPECNGECKVPVTFSEMQDIQCSNENAAWKAGEISHYRQCPLCHGEGVVGEDEL